MPKTVPFQTIQFCISTQFNSIWPIDRTLSGATTLGLNGPGSDGNEGLLCIPQNSSIIRTSPSDHLLSCLGHSLGAFSPSAEVQPLYSRVPADWANSYRIFMAYLSIGMWWTVMTYGICFLFLRRPKRIFAVTYVFYSPSQLAHQDTRCGSFTPLQRCCRCILQPCRLGKVLIEFFHADVKTNFYPLAAPEHIISCSLV